MDVTFSLEVVVCLEESEHDSLRDAIADMLGPRCLTCFQFEPHQPTYMLYKIVGITPQLHELSDILKQYGVI